MRVLFQNRSKIIVGGLIAAGLLLVVFIASKPPDSATVKRLPKDCHGRLALLDDAITRWATNNHKGQVEAPTKSELLPYVEWDWVMHCPQGGKYTLGALRLATTCDLHGHATKALPIYPAPTKFERFLDDFKRGFRARTKGGGPPCIQDMWQIGGAIQQWALENKRAKSDVVVPSEILGFMKGSNLPPICPLGGKYVLGRVTNAPICTIEHHRVDTNWWKQQLLFTYPDSP